MNVERSDEMLVGTRTLTKGDNIKIDGERAQKFIFMGYVINRDNGAEWVDVIHVQKGSPGPMRSFRPDRVRLLPKKRKKKNGKV